MLKFSHSISDWTVLSWNLGGGGFFETFLEGSMDNIIYRDYIVNRRFFFYCSLARERAWSRWKLVTDGCACSSPPPVPPPPFSPVGGCVCGCARLCYIRFRIAYISLIYCSPPPTHFFSIFSISLCCF